MMSEIILKFKRLLNVFKRDKKSITRMDRRTTPLYVKKSSIQSQVEKYTDNYTPIKRNEKEL